MSNLKFKNGSFKIMQIADVQERAKPNDDTIKLITLALERENPDLVVFTGDQVMGYSITYKKDTAERVKNCILSFLEPVVKMGIPFAVTFGNHDDDCCFSKEEQMAFYSKFLGFIYSEPRCVSDPGTFCIQIDASENDAPVMNIYLIDTNKKSADGAYSGINSEQIQWYKNKREALKVGDEKYLPSMVFQHIPMPEYYDIIKRVPPFFPGSVEAYKNRKNTFYCLYEDSKRCGGFMGESPAVPQVNNGEFESLREKGDVFAVFVGHDHNNSFYRNYKGIDLGYTQGTGFNTYGPGSKRGVRIFTFNENDIRNYKTYTVTMRELCKYRASKPLQEFGMRNSPSCIDEALTTAKRIAVIAGTVYAFKTIKKALRK